MNVRRRTCSFFLKSLAATAVLACFFSPAAGFEHNTRSTAPSVAITFDDLPYVPLERNGHAVPASEVETAHRHILAALRHYRAPATGFVIESQAKALGRPARRLLRAWTAGPFELGNHSFSHADFNRLDIDRIRYEIVEGEATIRPLVEGAGRRVRFFRVPYNHLGESEEKQRAIAEILAGRGYLLAPCTIDASDYLFDQAFERALAARDKRMQRRIKAAYIGYTAREIAFYARLNRQVLGYEPPEIMLLHLNRLNTETIGSVLELFSRAGYRFVSLSEAASDPAYRAWPSATKLGTMWGYRWAHDRGMKPQDGPEEEPPEWLTRYAAANKD